MIAAGGKRLVVVGLGPGDVRWLLPDATRWLAADVPVTVRTKRHPTVDALPQSSGWATFDDLYDTATDFESLYDTMVDRLRLTLAMANGSVVYAVPGHPLFAEATVRSLLDSAMPIEIVPGLSVLDAVAVALRRDPIAEGWQLLDALDLAQIGEADPFASGSLCYFPQRPALVCQVYNRRIASAVKLALMRVLPDAHLVTVVRAGGIEDHEQLVTLPLYEIDRDERLINHVTSIYVPALSPLEARRVPQTLAHITAQLRAPNGCPWDREQTHASLAQFAIEEAYEVVDAIDQGDVAALCEELGDLLLQVVLHAQVAEEAGEFTIEDVIEAISAKLVRRHPHVFGAVSVTGSDDVVRNWDQIKAAEREAKGGRSPASESIFSGVPRALPALSRAQASLRRADSIAPVAISSSSLLVPETDAVVAAMPENLRRQLVGKHLLTVSALARRHGIDAEEALRQAIDEFQLDVQTSYRADDA